MKKTCYVLSLDYENEIEKNAVYAGCREHKRGIGIKREISREIEHVFILLSVTRDGAAVHNSL